jgi:hypothetical protein
MAIVVSVMVIVGKIVSNVIADVVDMGIMVEPELTE